MTSLGGLVGQGDHTAHLVAVRRTVGRPEDRISGLPQSMADGVLVACGSVGGQDAVALN